MSKIMYRRHSWKAEIETHEVVAETAKFVTIRTPHDYARDKFIDSRRAKEGFFDTWEACKADMVERARREVEGCKESLHRARTELGMVEAMKPPATAKTAAPAGAGGGE